MAQIRGRLTVSILKQEVLNNWNYMYFFYQSASNSDLWKLFS